MRVATFSALFLIVAVMLVITVACQAFISDFVQPRTVFAALIAGTVLSGVVSLLINIEIAS